MQEQNAVKVGVGPGIYPAPLELCRCGRSTAFLQFSNAAEVLKASSVACNPQNGGVRYSGDLSKAL